jgi:hypothetical protein
MALNSAATAYRYNGTSWSSALPVTAGEPAPTPAAADISCTSPTFCAAVPGGNEVVLWDGLSWVDPQTLGGAQGLQALACANGAFCVTVDGEGDAYFYNGRWSSAVNAWGGPSSISCLSSTFCMATAGGTAQWNGHDWSQPQDVDTSGQLDTVSCTSPSFCVAADSVGNVLTWSGSSWSPPQPVDTAAGGGAVAGNGITAVSCVGPTFCVAVDNGGRALVFDGTTWSKPSDIDGRTGLVTVSCATTTFCLAVDALGRALTYR